MAGSSVGEKGVNPLEIGRRRYQQKEYEAALRAFSQATELCTGSLRLTALDYRAATNEKLGQLQAALRDSKEMIELSPDRAKGYLRCGKVLHLKGEKELAMKIYERGLRKVKIGTDDERAALQSMFNKLRRIMKPGISLDPFEYLPFELVQMILQYLPTRDRVICLAVSKPWKGLLESSPKLWTRFDTSHMMSPTFVSTGRPRRPITLHSLKVHFRRSKYTLDTAVIAGRDAFDSSKMEFLTRTCKDLRHLETHGFHPIGDSLINALPLAKNLSTIIIKNNTSASVMLQALQICQKTLVKAVFMSLSGALDATQAWPALESMECLDLRNGRSPIGINLGALIRSVPNIRELTLVDCDSDQNAPRLDLSGCERLESLWIRTLCSNRVPIFPSSLKHLDLQGNGYMHSGTVPPGEVFDLPLLESLDCTLTGQLDVSLINSLIDKSNAAGRLKRLSLGGRYRDDGVSKVEEQYPASTSVTELSIASIASNCVKEDRMLAVVALFPNLRVLDASRNQYITGVAVKQFVKQGITHMNLVNCPDISPDAIQWARSEGVVVEYKLNVQRIGMRTTWRDRLVALYE